MSRFVLKFNQNRGLRALENFDGDAAVFAAVNAFQTAFVTKIGGGGVLIDHDAVLGKNIKNNYFIQYVRNEFRQIRGIYSTKISLI